MKLRKTILEKCLTYLIWAPIFSVLQLICISQSYSNTMYGFVYPAGDQNIRPTEDNSSGNGYRISQSYQANYPSHTGVDFANGSTGGDVRAIAAGQVVHQQESTSSTGWGHMIRIKHILPDGSIVYSQYAHMDIDSLTVERNDWVAKGQKIGEVGATGYCVPAGAAHLHFEIKIIDENGCGYIPDTDCSAASNNWGNYYDPLQYVQDRFVDTWPLFGDWDNNAIDAFGTFDFEQPGFTLDGSPVIPFGTLNDLPITGDWDGDGTDEIGLFRPREADDIAQSNFYLDLDNDGDQADRTVAFPYHPENMPIVGDWDGDGYDDIGGFDPSSNTFYLYLINNSSNATLYRSVAYGSQGDFPITGDWDGDGDDDIGVFRKCGETNCFFLDIDLTGGQGEYRYEFGDTGDLPITGDWNPADGDDDIGVYKPSASEFYTMNIDISNETAEPFYAINADAFDSISPNDNNDESSVLGAPGSGFYSLGGGYIIVEMQEWFRDGSGADIFIYEVGAVTSSTNEPFDVFISSDKVNWTKVADNIMDDPGKSYASVNISGNSGSFKYIKVVDRATDLSWAYAPGSDIDAIGALYEGEALPLINPSIYQDRLSGLPGTTFEQWGDGFTRNSTATLHFKTPITTGDAILQRNLSGIWEGSYTCSQGLTNLRLEITENASYEIDAVFNFYANVSNPSVPAGSFRMVGTYDAISKAINLDATEWIDQPSGWLTVDLSGTVSHDNRLMTGNVLGGSGSRCTTFNVEKTEYLPLEVPIDENGHFEKTYTVQSDKTAGTYTWWAVDGPTSIKSNEISYEIVDLDPISTTSTTTSITTTTTSICDEGDLCCTEQIFGENAPQSELLRYFRDNVLNKTQEGRELIRLYYLWSPIISVMMNEDEDFRAWVQEMIEDILPLIL
ncbi:MAG: M23 family metallopeptidase [Tissierellales bacterium]|nr:M23 family metallopeptidase [Tissierellales bacterium]